MNNLSQVIQMAQICFYLEGIKFFIFVCSYVQLAIAASFR